MMNSILQDESECLQKEIQKLNIAVVTMMKEQPYQESFKYNRSITHQTIDFQESMNISEIRYRVDQEYILNLVQSKLLQSERLSMKSEDFRAFQFRRSRLGNSEQTVKVSQELREAFEAKMGWYVDCSSIQAVVESVIKMCQKSIECSLSDLYALHSDLSQIIDQAQQGFCKHGKLIIGPVCLNITLNSTLMGVLAKHKIYNVQNRIPNSDYILVLQNHIRKLEQELVFPQNLKEFTESLKREMKIAYESQEFFSEPQNMNARRSLVQKSVSSTQLQNKNTLQAKQQFQEAKEKYDWEFSQLAILRQNLTARYIQLMQKAELIQKRSQVVKIQNIQLQKFKEKLEKEKQIIKQEKQTFSKQTENLRQKTLHTKKQLEMMMKFHTKVDIDNVAVTRKYSYDQKVISAPQSPLLSDDDDQIQSLKKQILDLTASSEYPNDSSQLRINRLQTQLSNLRSQKSIHNTNKNISNVLEKATSQLNYRSKSKPPLSFIIKTSENQRIDTLISPKTSKNFFPVKIGKPPIIERRKVNYVEGLKQVEIIKTRLCEREEKLKQKETWMLQQWRNIPDSVQLVSMIQKEKNRIGAIQAQIQVQQDNIDKREIELASKQAKLKLKQITLQKKCEKFEKKMVNLNQERLDIEEKVFLLLKSFN